MWQRYICGSVTYVAALLHLFDVFMLYSTILFVGIILFILSFTIKNVCMCVIQTYFISAPMRVFSGVLVSKLSYPRYQNLVYVVWWV